MAAIVGFALSALLVFILAWLYKTYLEIKRIGKEVDKLPGPEKHWLYGNLHQFPGTQKMLDYNMDLTKKYGSVYKTWLGPHMPIVHLVSPETVKMVMRSSEPKMRFQVGGGGYDLLIPWLGEGLIVSEGNHWHRMRRLLTPAFHFEILKKYQLVHNKCAGTFLQVIESRRSKTDKFITIDNLVCMATLDNVLKCAFSCEEDVQLGENTSDFAQNNRDCTRLLVERFIKPWLHKDLVYQLTGEGRTFFGKVNSIHKFADDVILRRKRHLEGVGYENSKVLDFLDVLLLASDTDGSGLTVQEIRNEVNTFMFAGHDTTSSALTWILYNMASHPEIQEKARQDVRKVLKGKETDDISWEDMSKFDYLTCCIKESLRLHPPVPYIDRRLTKETEVEGVELLPGTLIELGIYELHHNPDVWDSPMDYIPERFKEPLADPFMFVPFSGGPRNCIGQNFAMNELHVMTAKTLNRYRLSCDPDHRVDVRADVVLRSTNGVRIMFEPIDKNM